MKKTKDFAVVAKKRLEKIDKDKAAMRAALEKWMLYYWGEQCPDFEPDCQCCKAWRALKDVFQEDEE